MGSALSEKALGPPKKALGHPRGTLAVRSVRRYARLKEILESVEFFKVVERLVVSRPARCAITRIVDVACGHGMVSVLLALRFPAISVVAVDVAKRPAFDALVEACGAAPKNLRFVESDLAAFLAADAATSPSTAVVAVHACNKLNADAVDFAVERGAAWVVLPCCLPQARYLPRTQTVGSRPSDHDRFALLVGAMALHYGAETLTTIDARITPRNLALAGGFQTSTARDAAER